MLEAIDFRLFTFSVGADADLFDRSRGFVDFYNVVGMGSVGRRNSFRFVRIVVIGYFHHRTVVTVTRKPTHNVTSYMIRLKALLPKNTELLIMLHFFIKKSRKNFLYILSNIRQVRTSSNKRSS